ncbi:MAG: hypothetical protein WDO15_28705 [Bacteroidota bacterium]
MKTFLIACLLTIVINCHAQDWVKHKLDENLTVTIPENFEPYDTLGTRNVKAQIDNALVLIQSLPNKGENATNIPSREELLKAYKGFQDGVIKVQHGTLVSQDFEVREGLQVTRFTFTATMGDEKQIRHYLVVFLNEYWYTVTFWEVDGMSNDLQPLRDQLFESIELPKGLSVKNQFSNAAGSQSDRIVAFTEKLFGKVIFIGLIVGLVYLVFKRKKK